MPYAPILSQENSLVIQLQTLKKERERERERERDKLPHRFLDQVVVMVAWGEPQNRVHGQWCQSQYY